jgi:hypothetical protein
MSEIEKAVRHEDRIKLHAQMVLEENEFGPGYRMFTDWVRGFLPEDVFHKFIKLIRPPFPTVEVVETIFDELSRVFDGKNKFYKDEFKNSDYQTDANDFLERLNFSKFWRTDGFEAQKDSFNSYVVVDLPAEQKTPLPEPYFYLLDAINVWDVEHDSNNNVTWILIKEAEEQFLYIDQFKYQRIFKLQFQEEIPHALAKHKRCPVRNISKFKRTRKNYVDRKSPLTSSVGELDWLLFFETSKKYLDLYGPFPIYSGYEQVCSNVKDGAKCDNGLLHYYSEEYGNHSVTCDKCKGKGKPPIGETDKVQTCEIPYRFFLPKLHH